MSNHIFARLHTPRQQHPVSARTRARTPASTVISHSAKASVVVAVIGGMIAAAFPAGAGTTNARLRATPQAASGPFAIAAPSAMEPPLVAPAFGDIAFTGIAPPKPVRTRERASRSATRTPVAARAARATRATRVHVATRIPAPRSTGVLGIAASLAGIYYVYGGTTPAGFDCSGFVQYVFRQVGVSLPRTAEQQRQATTRVSNPAPGDLVFFGAPAHHVGIYAGGGMMWDSPHTGAAISKRAIYSSNVTYGRV